MIAKTLKNRLAPGRLLPLLALFCAFAGGCNQQIDPKIVELYSQADYRSAYAEASRAASTYGGPAREQAQFIAGMSAFQLGNTTQALGHLAEVQDSDDPSIAGHGNATMGIIHYRAGRFATSRKHFEAALPKIAGQHQAECHYYLGLLDQRTGHWASARTHMSLAGNISTNADFKNDVRQKMQATGFTLQVGVYSTPENAQFAASKFLPITNKTRIRGPKVIQTLESPGRKLYRVQIGEFPTWDAALSARKDIGRTDAMIVLLGG